MYSTNSDKGIVSTTEKDASSAAIDILNSGGNANDAALAASGVLSVNSQHQCGIGGDLFALIYINNKVYALNSSGSHESSIEQPASSSGITTFLSGLRIFALSPINFTPQNAIISASVSVAFLDKSKESPTKSAISCISGD